MTAKTSRQLNMRQRLWRWKWVVLIVVFVAGAAGWRGYQQLQIHNQYEQFMQAKNDLHVLSQEIVAAVGQPDQQKATQTCGYTSEEFSRGARFCDVDEFLLYDVQDEPAAQLLATRISGAASSSKLVEGYHTDSYLPTGTLVSTSFVLPSFKQCGLQEAFFANEEQASPYDGFLVDGHKVLSLELNCGGAALSEYFEVQN